MQLPPLCKRINRTFSYVIKITKAAHVQKHYLFLLGLRNAIKTDINTSPTHGEPLCLPGEMLEIRKDFSNLYNPFDFLNSLGESIPNLKFWPAKNHAKNKLFIFQDLKSCSHIFLRVNTKTPLIQPLQGPFRVLERGDKTFVIQEKKGLLLTGSNLHISLIFSTSSSKPQSSFLYTTHSRLRRGLMYGLSTVKVLPERDYNFYAKNLKICIVNVHACNHFIKENKI